MFKTIFISFFIILFPVLGLCQEQGVDITEEDEQTLQELESQRLDGARDIDNNLNGLSLMDEKFPVMLQEALSKNDLSQHSRESIRSLLMEKMKGTPLEKVAAFFPGLVDLFVDLLRDKKALPGLVQILSRKEDLRTIAFIWLGIMVFGFLIKKYAIPKKASFWKRTSISLGVTLGLTLLSFGIFSNMFYEELGPTFQIIKNHLSS